MKLIEDVEDDWNCSECGNDTLDGSVENKPSTQTNFVIYRCSVCRTKIAYRIL